tara:strand:+ start:26 stop:499 length:474 start_codon:yes stop_codon:yes gene_type:complete
MKNNIIKGRNGILVILILVILLFCVNNFFIRENFKDGLDDVDAMNKKMDEMTEMEKETRMFCKLLRHDEDREQLQDLLDSRNQEFQDNWQKQNKIVSDIKKKFIKLRLEKDGRNFKDFNDKRNMRLDENIKRKEVIKQAKKIAESPYNLAVNINNNS